MDRWIELKHLTDPTAHYGFDYQQKSYNTDESVRTYSIPVRELKLPFSYSIFSFQSGEQSLWGFLVRLYSHLNSEKLSVELL